VTSRPVAGQGDLGGEDGDVLWRASTLQACSEVKGDLLGLQRVPSAQVRVLIEHVGVPPLRFGVFHRHLADPQHDRTQLLEGPLDSRGSKR